MTAPAPPTLPPKLSRASAPAGFLSGGLLRTAKLATAAGAGMALTLAVLPAPRASESFEVAMTDWRSRGAWFPGPAAPNGDPADVLKELERESAAPVSPLPAAPTLLADADADAAAPDDGAPAAPRFAALDPSPGGPRTDSPAAPLADRPARRPATAPDPDPFGDFEFDSGPAVPPAALVDLADDPPTDAAFPVADPLGAVRSGGGGPARVAQTPVDSRERVRVSRVRETTAPPVPAEPLPRDRAEGIGRDLLNDRPAPVFPAGRGEPVAGGAFADDGEARFDLDLGAGAPLPAVLASLGRASGLNVVAGEGVTGTVTASLRGVTAEEALTALGRAHGFTHRREGRFVYLTGRAAADAERAAAETQRLAAEAASRRVVTRLYRPHYVPAGEVVSLLTPLLTPGVGVAQATLPPVVGLPLSGEEAGGDSLAQRDAVVVRDYPEVLTEIDALLEQLDVPPAQVAIEAVILRVALTDETSLGVNFALLDEAARGLAVSGAGVALAGATGIPGTAAAGGAAGGAVQAANAVYGTGFTAAEQAGLRLGTVAGSVSSFVEALERFGSVSTVATPSVRVLNKQRGEVVIGRRLGYRTTVVNGATAAENVQFIDAGTKLVLRPFVAPDGLIRLEVHPEKSAGIIDAQGIPQLDTTEVTTNVMVRDGQTVLIAGLIEESVTEDTTGIPVLGTLPLVGGAFRTTTERIEKSELVVLLTPRVVREPVDAARGAWLEAAGRAALDRAAAGVPDHGRLPRAARLHAEARRAYCAGDLREAWRKASEALRLRPTEPAYAALRRDVAAALLARGETPPPLDGPAVRRLDRPGPAGRPGPGRPPGPRPAGARRVRPGVRLPPLRRRRRRPPHRPAPARLRRPGVRRPGRPRVRGPVRRPAAGLTAPPGGGLMRLMRKTSNTNNRSPRGFPPAPRPLAGGTRRTAGNGSGRIGPGRS